MDDAQLQEILDEFGVAPISEAEYDRLIADAQEALADSGAHTTAPLMEAAAPRIVVPRRGSVIAEDGTCQLAIMRPCVSRGRKLRGLPPLYEPQMLARNAGVFTNWPMFMNHVPAELQEEMLRRGRRIEELGGRITESWYDPEFRLADDDDYGYKPGAVLGRAIPQEPIAAMISRDPEVLHTSINAWPTSARPRKLGNLKVMEIEGIRAKPSGSVDWVVRGGAGGRVLHESEYSDAVKRAVSSLAAHYGAPTVSTSTETAPDFSAMTAEQLRAYVREHAPHLSEALVAQPTETVAESSQTLDDEVVQAIVDARLAEALEDLRQTLSGQEDRLEERAQQIVSEREQARTLAERARELIERAPGLTPTVRRDLRARYSVLPSGPTQALAECEATEDRSAEEILLERLERDIEYARGLVAEAQGRPAVHGQGGAPTSGAAPDLAENYWVQQLVAEGVIEKPEEALKVMGSVSDAR